MKANNSRLAKWLVLLATIAILGIATFVGCTVGVSIASYLNSADAVRWQSIGIPPEKARKIRVASTLDITIESVSGKLYTHYLFETQNDWQEISSGSVPTLKSDHFQNYPPISLPDLPKTSIDTAYYDDDNGEYIRKVAYAISEDGMVWVWQWNPSTLGLVYGVLPGSTIGFSIGIILSALLWRLNRKQNVGS